MLSLGSKTVIFSKICGRCSVEKGLEFFPHPFATSHSWCRPCNIEYQREYRLIHGEAIKEQNRKNYTDRHEARLAAKAIYRSENQEKVNQSQRNYYLRNKGKQLTWNAARRAKKAGVPSDGSTRDDIWVKDNGICHLCLKAIPDQDRFNGKAWHVDHKHPLTPIDGSEPGHDTVDNKFVAHTRCNLSKRNKIIESGAFADELL